MPLEEQEEHNLPEFIANFSGVGVAQSMDFCVGFVHCSFLFLWIMHCLPFIYLHLLLTTLVSSNVSAVVFLLLDIWSPL